MHRRVIKSLVPLMGAAALVVAPIALAAPASAAVNPEENQAWFWESYLEDEDIFAICNKVEPVPTPYVVPEVEDVFSAEDIEDWFPEADSEDLAYVLAVVKAGSGDDANELVWDPMVGDELSHNTDKDNSHVILCIGELVDEEESPSPTTTASTKPSTKPSTTKPATTKPATTKPATTKPGTTKPATSKPATGPVVETDSAADAGSAAGLGLAAAASALIIGVGGMAIGRRRQGSHR